VSQSISFVFHFPGFAELFEHGLISFAVELLINQLGNIVSAFVWFAYWPSDTMIIWVLVAYLGYRLGVKLAKQEKQLDIDELWRKFFDK
jgi:mannose/fructose/N-acetylgalactosamine-specific phosphotransferase system component IID